MKIKVTLYKNQELEIKEKIYELKVLLNIHKTYAANMKI
jgi:hypothetical protein